MFKLTTKVKQSCNYLTSRSQFTFKIDLTSKWPWLSQIAIKLHFMNLRFSYRECNLDLVRSCFNEIDILKDFFFNIRR